MPRRRKNNTQQRGYYTYLERLRDKHSQQYGNFERRLGRDSIKDFDVCAIALAPCKVPMVTEQGVIFDKEQVLTYILEQKNDIKLQSRAYKEYLNELKEKDDHDDRVKKQKELNNFLKGTESLVVRTDPLNNILRSIRGEQATPELKGQFWRADTVDIKDSDYATLTDGKGDLKRTIVVEDGLLDGTGFGGTAGLIKTAVQKPDKHVRCPVTKEILDFAKMYPVNFTKRLNRHEKAGSSSTSTSTSKSSSSSHSSISKPKYCCAISGDPLTNSTQLIIFKKGGQVISQESFDKVVKLSKKEFKNPFTDEKITDKDFIKLRRGGTGFAHTNDLQKTEQGVVFMAS